MFSISTTVDGGFHFDDVEPRMLLVHYLRSRVGRTGTVVGCDTSNCGACTVLLNGLSVKSCTVLAIQADGSEITTVQGVADGELHPVQKAFHDNLAVPGLLHMAIARSPVAHARIGGTDISAALRQPGVVAAFTGADLAGDYGSLPTVWHVSDDLIVPDHRPVVADEARYLGDAVAVVVAEEPYQAADALEAVGVDYEDLPPVIDMVAALAPGAPLVHADKGTNRAFTWGFTAGDYEAAKAGADVVVSRLLVQQRVIPAAMETRAVLAEPAPATGEFTLWTATRRTAGEAVRSGPGWPDARGRPRLSPGSPPSGRDRCRSHAHASRPARASDAVTIG